VLDLASGRRHDRPMPDTDTLYRLQRRTVAVLIVAQIVGGAGLASGVAVGALIAANLLADPGLSGLPFALAVGGTTVSAIPLARLMRRRGRRIGLTLAWTIGATGAGLVALAAVHANTALFLVGMALFGAASAGGDAARYAASDLAGNRGRAMGTLVFATTLAAIGGPLLLGPSADVAGGLGAEPLAGPFLLSAVAFLGAAAVLHRHLRPDPLLVAATQVRDRDATPAGSVPDEAGRTGRGSLLGALVGAAAMGLANFAMILAMVGSPAELEAGGAGLGAIGVVVALHIAAMFAPSPLTGWLSDRVGPLLVIGLAAAAMTAAAVLFVVAGMDQLSAGRHGSHPGHGTGPGGSVALPAALVLVGIAWNFGFIGGSTQLARSLPHGRRVAAQGAADAGMGAAGLIGALASGAVVAVGGLPAVGTVLAFVGGAFLVAAALPVAGRATTRRKPWIDRVPPRGPILEAQPDATGSA